MTQSRGAVAKGRDAHLDDENTIPRQLFYVGPGFLPHEPRHVADAVAAVLRDDVVLARIATNEARPKVCHGAGQFRDVKLRNIAKLLPSNSPCEETQALARCNDAQFLAPSPGAGRTATINSDVSYVLRVKPARRSSLKGG